MEVVEWGFTTRDQFDKASFCPPVKLIIYPSRRSYKELNTGRFESPLHVR